MSRRRRSHGEDHENHERWIVSYADFITLLFAFFVVMFAISSVNEGKYKVLSETLSETFADPQIAARRIPIINDNILPVLNPIPATASGGDDPIAREKAALDALFAELQHTLSPYLNEGSISLIRDTRWIEVEMKSSLLFPSGSADLTQAAFPVLRQISDTLRSGPQVIHVEGHTDDVPITTYQFPSNWELSAARAASVVHELMRNGVEPRRMAAVAYSQYQPSADNKTDEGRSRNRRVSLIVLPPGEARRRPIEAAPSPAGSISPR